LEAAGSEGHEPTLYTTDLFMDVMCLKQLLSGPVVELAAAQSEHSAVQRQLNAVAEAQ